MLFIHIGSLNPQKVAAVKEEFLRIYPLQDIGLFDQSAPDTGVPEQPKTLSAVVEGAMNRARLAIEPAPRDSNIHLGVGLESGLFTPEGHPNVISTITCCAVSRVSAMGSVGTIHGFSSAFTIPERILQHVRVGHDLSQATARAGYTTHPKIGEGDGLISLLSKGRVTRRDQLKEAVRNALFHIDELL